MAVFSHWIFLSKPVTAGWIFKAQVLAALEPLQFFDHSLFFNGRRVSALLVPALLIHLLSTAKLQTRPFRFSA